MPKIVDAQEKKKEICELAYSSLLEDGIENFSLNKFIGSLDISKGQFYHYFRSKESLIFATLEAKDREIIDFMQQQIDKKDNLFDKLTAFFAFYIDDEEQIYIDTRKLMVESMHLYCDPKFIDEAMNSCSGMYAQSLKILDDIFAQAIKQGELPKEARKYVKIIFATVDGLYMQSLVFKNNCLKDDVINFLKDFINLIKR